MNAKKVMKKINEAISMDDFANTGVTAKIDADIMKALTDAGIDTRYICSYATALIGSPFMKPYLTIDKNAPMSYKQEQSIKKLKDLISRYGLGPNDLVTMTGASASSGMSAMKAAIPVMLKLGWKYVGRLDNAFRSNLILWKKV